MCSWRAHQEPDQASGTDGRGLTNQLDHLDLDSTAAADVCVVVPDNAVEVYNNYNFAVNYDPSLPITKMRKKVCFLCQNVFLCMSVCIIKCLDVGYVYF